MREMGDKPREGAVLIGLVLLLAAQEDFEAALPYARAAVAVLETTEDAAGLAKAKRTLASLPGGAETP